MTENNSLAVNIKLKNINDIQYVRFGYSTSDPTSLISSNYLQIAKSATQNLTSTDTLIFTTSNNYVLSKINLIQLLNNSQEVLAYRKIPQVISIIQGNNTISIEVAVSEEVTQEIIVTFDLDYTSHVNADVSTQHNNINNLTIINNTYPLTDFITYASNKNSLMDIYNEYSSTPTTLSKGLYIPADSTGYFENISSSYDHQLLYYWNNDYIVSFLNDLIGVYSQQAEKSFLTAAKTEIANIQPFIGFNSEYGSFLYWYKFSSEYILFIVAGSNIYNHVDVYFVDNTFNLTYGNSYFNSTTNNFRLKVINYFSSLYFVIDNKLYSIEPKLEKKLYIVKNKIQLDTTNVLNYSIRSPQKNDILFSQNSITREDDDGNEHTFTKIYNFEYSDLNHILLGYDSEDTEGVYYYFFNAVNDQTICIPAQYSTNWSLSSICTYPVLSGYANYYMFDSLNLTTAEQIRYLNSIDFEPVYINSSYTIGYSSIYGTFMILFKIPYEDDITTFVYPRRIVNSNYFQGITWINNDVISNPTSTKQARSIYDDSIVFEEDGLLPVDRNIVLYLQGYNNYFYYVRNF